MNSRIIPLNRNHAPVVRESKSSAPELVEGLILQAERASASDIHLQMREDSALISFRLDGVLAPVSELPKEMAERVFGRIKYLSRLKTYQDSLPQEGRIDKATAGAKNDIRVATYPTVTGEKIVLRLFNSSPVKGLSELEFPESCQSELQRFIARTSGLLLLTGPAGSGKTTTIYACVREMAQQGGRHIITVEDPAEQILPGIMQTEINDARGLSFAEAARHLLRQDPQVLVIGEIRDVETANIAVRAALTGHLVISTLHAGSCKGVFERLLVLCSDVSAVAASVELVLNQRLLRRLCPDCRGEGCPVCLDTGYRGRLPVVEYLRITDEMRPRIGVRSLDGVAPTTNLLMAAKTLVSEGLTDTAEVTRIVGHSI